MSVEPKTKSAAHRIGLVPCPACNVSGLPTAAITIPCAWCYNDTLKTHTRFITVDKAIEYATTHGMDPHDVPTPVESREALDRKNVDAYADTDPPPPTEKNK
jgi:hypothetical protein